MRKPDRADGEDADAERAANRKGTQFGFVERASLVQAPGDRGAREGCRPDRAGEYPRKTMLDGADVVLVRMRDDQGVNAPHDAAQGFGIGDIRASTAPDRSSGN